MARLAIDPVTRVGGHLRIEVEVTNGAVSDAWSSGTVFRGMEAILEGRDPRGAWLLAQRVCGTCTGVHALGSVRAVENALGVTIPTNARLVRNLMAGTQLVLDHVSHFYQQHALDWVDVDSALRADPAAAARFASSLSDRPATTTASFKAVSDRIAASARSGPFAALYAGHPAFRLPPEANLVILADYLAALDWQRKVGRVQTLLGGKSPHPQTFLVGGMALAPSWGGPSRGGPGEHPQQVDRETLTALGDGGLAEIGDLIAAAKTFVDQVYVPDLLSIARTYGDWTAIGKGPGAYLAYGEFPEDDSADPQLHLPRGRVMDRDLTRIERVDQASVGESVAHAYYAETGGDGGPRHPLNELTQPSYSGPKPPFTTLEGSERYSWIKAPRYEGEPMEVGPLARMLVAQVEGRRDVQLKLQAVLSKLGTGPDALFSTLGRTVARAIEAQVIVDRLAGWHDALVASLATGDVALVDLSLWDPGTWPAAAQGWSLGESARGAVGHWVKLRDGRIEHYELVDATTWNASPRDAQGRRGPLEAALIGTPVVDPGRPLEVLRTVHSFAPCTACAVHRFDPTGPGPIDVRVAEGAR